MGARYYFKVSILGVKDSMLTRYSRLKKELICYLLISTSLRNIGGASNRPMSFIDTRKSDSNIAFLPNEVCSCLLIKAFIYC
jgi:hypothetical protein